MLSSTTHPVFVHTANFLNRTEDTTVLWVSVCVCVWLSVVLHGLYIISSAPCSIMLNTLYPFLYLSLGNIAILYQINCRCFFFACKKRQMKKKIKAVYYSSEIFSVVTSLALFLYSFFFLFLSLFPSFLFFIIILLSKEEMNLWFLIIVNDTHIYKHVLFFIFFLVVASISG